MKAIVSIIMPVHQVPQALLHRAVASVADQSMDQLELILVDDGNEDAWRDCFQIPPQIGRHLALQVVRLDTRSGIAAARNAGAARASGQWLMWLDGDDWLEADCVERLLEASEGAKLVMGECNVVEAGEVMVRGPGSILERARTLIGTRSDPLMRFIFAIQPQLIRTDVFWALNGFDETYQYAELTDLFLRFVSRFGLDDVEVAPKARYNYERRPLSVSSAARQELEAYRLRTLAAYCARAGHAPRVIKYVGWNGALDAREYALTD